jgi:hypothetical protein
VAQLARWATGCRKEFDVTYIIRKDGPAGRNWLPTFAVKVYGMKTYGRATAIEFARDRKSARRFENREEAEAIATTFIVGSCNLTVEAE